MPSALPRRRDDVQSAVIDNEIVLLDSKGSQAGYLNATAAAIWQLCDGTRSAADIAATLAQLVDQPADSLVADVEQTIETLEAAGVLA
jgi:hypothetical protein